MGVLDDAMVAGSLHNKMLNRIIEKAYTGHVIVDRERWITIDGIVYPANPLPRVFPSIIFVRKCRYREQPCFLTDYYDERRLYKLLERYLNISRSGLLTFRVNYLEAYNSSRKIQNPEVLF